jgi:hypothetical protein
MRGKLAIVNTQISLRIPLGLHACMAAIFGEREVGGGHRPHHCLSMLEAR